MKKIKSNIHRQLSDFTTPVNVLLAIREKFPVTLLLESSDYQTKENSFSFIGFDPIASVKLSNNRLKTTFGDDISINLDDNRLSAHLDSFMKKFEFTTDDFEVKEYNGLFGYTSFEVVKHFDNHKLDPA